MQWHYGLAFFCMFSDSTSSIVQGLNDAGIYMYRVGQLK